MANFGEMAVALKVSRHRLENDLIKLRRLCASCGMSDGATQISVAGFERDIDMVDEATVILRELARYERDVLDLIKHKNIKAGWLSRLSFLACILF